MGSRGSVSRYGGGGGLNPGDILSTTDMISERMRAPEASRDILEVSRQVHEMYGEQVGSFVWAELKPGASAIAYYDGDKIGLNMSYSDAQKMSRAYADCVKSGFHPSNGTKTPTEAVAAHEFGHALTDAVGKKMGVRDIDTAATRIVTEARKSTSHRGVVQMASKISTYATHSNAEAVAEAFSDVFCNGRKAKSESHAIVKVINGYLGK